MTVTYIGFGYDNTFERSLDGTYCIFNGEWYVHPSTTLERAKKKYHAIMDSTEDQTYIARMKYDEETGMAIPIEAYTVGGDEW